MFSGMLGITGKPPENAIPETACGTVTAASLGLEETKAAEISSAEREALKSSAQSVSENAYASFGSAERDLPSAYSAADSRIYKLVGYTYETADTIRLKTTGILPTAATQSLDRLAAAGYIQSQTKSGKKNYKRLPEDLYIKDSTLSGGFIYACGEGTRITGDYEGSSFSSSFIAKHAEDGGLIKCVEISNSKAEKHLTGIAPVRGGGVAVCGYSDYGSAGGSKYAFITAYSTDIEELWSVKIYGEGNDFFSCISATPDGGFVTGGKTTSTTHDFDGIPDYGSSVAVIMKFNGSGQKIWTRYLGGSGASETVDVDVDSSGNIFADISAIPNDGDFSAFGGLIKGSVDNVIIKYDSNGLMKWNFVLSTNGRDYFDKVCADGNGGCIAGGNFSLTSGNAYVTLGTLKGLSVSGGSDIYITGINSLGLKSWGRLLRGISNDSLTSIAKVKGGYLLTGFSESDNGEFEQNSGGYDAFADFISASGEQTAIFHTGGEGRDIATRAVSSGNRVCVFGDCDGTDSATGSVLSEYFVKVYDIS